MKARLGLLLVMIPAVLTSGCVRYDRGMPIFVDSSTLSIQTVQYGTMPPPAHTAGIDLHLPDHRAPIQVLAGGKIENTLYIERGNFHTEIGAVPKSRARQGGDAGKLCVQRVTFGIALVRKAAQRHGAVE